VASTPSLRVELVTARGCHLCDAARSVVGRVRSEVEFDFVETDITGVPELEARYRERIPVVLVDGVEAFHYHVHPDGLRQRLSRAQSR